MLDWQQIPGFKDYAVDEVGQVANLQLRTQMKTRMNSQGLIMVGLRQDGRQHMRSVAKLVAEAFVDREYSNFNTVIHLNGDHADCRASNLRWRTRPFAYHYHRMFEDLPLRVGVYIPSTKETFRSLREACTTYGLIEQMAYRAMLNQESAFPYQWIMEPLPTRGIK